MPWVNIDDGFDEHPKVEALLDEDELRGLAAVGLFTLLLSKSARRLTDGKVSARQIVTVAPTKGMELAERLLRARLLDRDGDDLQIHDYLDWNPSKEQVLAKRAKRSAAGSKGGKAKAASQATGLANATAGASSVARQTVKHGGTPQVRPLDVPTTTTTTTPLQGVRGGGDRAAVRDALVAAGFDRLDVETHDSAIGVALAEHNVPGDVDWFAFGQRLREKREDGSCRSPKPDGALRFMFRGLGSLPRVGDGRPGASLFKSTTGVDPAMAAKYGSGS